MKFKTFLLGITLLSLTSCTHTTKKTLNTNYAKNIQLIARFKIQPGKMDNFKKIASQCIESVKKKDKGTLRYDWYYNESKSECVVKERYVDSDAVLNHSSNLGNLLNSLNQISTLTLEIYGNPSEKLKKVLEGAHPTYYAFETGL